MTQTAPATVPYEVWKHEHDLRIKAEQDLQYYKNEFFLQRKIRRAPVLQPIDKAILEECRHVEKWGTVKAPDGSTRANFKTIAKDLHSSPGTITTHAERLEKLGLIDIHEHQGPKDECERKYVHVKEEKLPTLHQLKDPDKVVPEQGGNRYICLNDACNSTDVSIRIETDRKITIHCNQCQEEHAVTEHDDTGWRDQFGHKLQKAQKQLAFGKSKHALHAETEDDEPQKQLAEHSVYTRAIEDELRQLSQWVVWRYEEDGQGKPTKVPYIARLMRLPQKAKTNDPTTWEACDQAQAIYEQSHREGWKHPYDGIGFVFNSNGIVGIDLDHCIDPDTGEMSDQAQAIVERLGTYAEISVSKTGLHLYARGILPRNIKQPGIELYDHARFFTWTGRQLPGTPNSIMDCQAALDALCAEIAPPVALPQIPNALGLSYSHTDAEILTKAEGDAKFRKLWSGDASDYRKKDGSPDYSRADLALCRKLSYWGAGGDVSTIDRLFQQSRLMRPKWFKNVGNGETYGQRTIRVAIGEQERRAS